MIVSCRREKTIREVKLHRSFSSDVTIKNVLRYIPNECIINSAT
jgi:hypothetical protein